MCNAQILNQLQFQCSLSQARTELSVFEGSGSVVWPHRISCRQNNDLLERNLDLERKRAKMEFSLAEAEEEIQGLQANLAEANQELYKIQKGFVQQQKEVLGTVSNTKDIQAELGRAKDDLAFKGVGCICLVGREAGRVAYEEVKLVMTETAALRAVHRLPQQQWYWPGCEAVNMLVQMQSCSGTRSWSRSCKRRMTYCSTRTTCGTRSCSSCAHHVSRRSCGRGSRSARGR